MEEKQGKIRAQRKDDEFSVIRTAGEGALLPVEGKQ